MARFLWIPYWCKSGGLFSTSSSIVLPKASPCIHLIRYGMVDVISDYPWIPLNMHCELPDKYAVVPPTYPMEGNR
jgi:hypothetical protein